MLKNYIGITRDHSISMYNISYGAMKDYNNLVESIRNASKEENQDTIVSVVECGALGGIVKRDVVNSSVFMLKPMEKYIANGGSTPLWDSVGELINILSSAPDANDPNVSFVVMVITDGQENSSRIWTGSMIADKVKQLQKTGKWTFTFRVPRGHSYSITRYGIPAGNVLEWETTERGIEIASHVTSESVRHFYKSRTAGLTSSKTFYADTQNLTQREIKTNLVDISPEVKLGFVNKKMYDGMQIKDFIENVMGENFVKGQAFYQLTKKEREVQDYKVICIMDKQTRKFYSGSIARNLLGIPTTGTIKLAPGDHENYEIFIQSTSVNRKLVGNSTVLVWKQVRAM
jgi:hypothetical protein